MIKETSCQGRRRRFDLCFGKIRWEMKWQLTLAFLPGESHGQRSSVGTAFGVVRVRHGLETKQWQQRSYRCSSAKQQDSSWLGDVSLEGMILERTSRFRMKELLAVGGSTAPVILRCLYTDGDQPGTKFSPVHGSVRR